ncbi:uncharacterized protein AMSG_04171 [Thecamonas trahens ATCC 50062]|uniref:Alpha-1,3/1,6-mannosyltransferase ALG2 n=1 Tax=Thecamonas trahens ATCC 50062 TaxID=461836 RepID=A0A0L0D769_THETB|nr:hypothetical protein AMSG_04171 [Thecamonas trahens ATCC 50062]KNC47936.1 hypothetical protein AMSG_04171 [Thecamonas trahens ATCC 50062]|eukprot:XP_013758955.1 hypothetical protein AMSG_04171 [Thecamonas trahens ATCC 50062]
MRIAFLHPDLGVGGAERLVIDAGMGLLARGHAVTMYTNHRDVGHCFPEARDGSLDVRVVGGWLPSSIFGMFSILCVTLRMLYAAVVMVIFYPRPDVVFLDQLATAVWPFRLVGLPVVFYCHFPDKLLASRSSSPLRIAYRAVADALEERSTRAADVVLVNSAFTAATVMEAFPSMTARPAVLYPAINMQAIDAAAAAAVGSGSELANNKVFFSINRFERKKAIELALAAFALMAADARGAQLVLAGGYDPNNRENAEYFDELHAQATELGLDIGTDVVFAPSVSNDDKYRYFDAAVAVLYTPSNEHFGIVPVEAMYASRPVVAVASGGPTESIVDGETGLLVAPEPAAFADAMRTLWADRALCARMGAAGRQRVRDLFSLDAFAASLEASIVSAIDGSPPAAGRAKTD